MVNNCSVRGCKRTRKSHPRLKLYSFPKKEDIKAEWVKFCDCRKEKGIPKSGKSNNFHCGHYIKNGKKILDQGILLVQILQIAKLVTAMLHYTVVLSKNAMSRYT